VSWIGGNSIAGECPLGVMMAFQNRITQYGFGAAFVLAALVVQYKILTAGLSLSTVMISLAVLIPFLFSSILALSGVWAGILIGALNIGFRIPAPVLQKMSPGLVITSIIIGVSLLRWLKGDFKISLFRTKGERCLVFVAAGIMLRILWDRPGSTNLGESGGAGEAVYYLVGGLAFLVASMVVPENWNVQKNIKVMMAFSVVGVIEGLIRPYLEDGSISTVIAFGQPVWLMSGLGLAWIHDHWNQRGALGNWISYIGLIALILGLATITPFRSRPVFALVQILVVAITYRQTRKAVFALMLVVSLGMGMLTLFSPSGVPRIAKRALSTVLDVDRSEASQLSADFEMSGEFGWQSEFRATLNRLAWASIREHPFSGKGFTFSTEELANSSSMMRLEGLDAGQMTLAVSGVYHNSVLALAVFCGLPLAVLYVIGAGSVCWRFIRCMMEMGNSLWRLFGVALLAFMAAVIGQMLMNGGGDTFMSVCIGLGVMNGMIARIQNGQCGDPLVSVVK